MIDAAKLALRDKVVARFRRMVYDKMAFVPFTHQAEWQLASEGWVLGGPDSGPSVSVRLRDDAIERMHLSPRPGGPARVLADLAAFKAGKSKGAGMWLSGFAGVPNAKVQLIGMEYDICAPEFEYLSEALLGSAGMNMRATEYSMRPREGRMVMVLPNGARFEARSWERKDALKGKEIAAYCFCEAYQFPGLDAYTSLKQNLTAQHGFALFPTTPDRPWVKVFHERGHGEDAAWHCTCGVPRSVNPYTWDAVDQDRDDPLKGGLMTRERFAIAYLGQLGEFVGRVFAYQRGSCVFDTHTHPGLWADVSLGPTRENLRLPGGWTVIGGADTGTYASAVLIAFSPEGEAFVVGEYPNYRYVAGVVDLDEGLSIPAWARRIELAAAGLGTRALFWADKNSQFKRELGHYGVTLLGNVKARELMTEITREYFTSGRIHLAPWLTVLPFELENAAWPEEASATGRFARVKDRDHTLDGLEHVLSKRPIGRTPVITRAQSWIESFYGCPPRAKRPVDAHLGGA